MDNGIISTVFVWLISHYHKAINYCHVSSLLAVLLVIGLVQGLDEAEA